MAAGRELLEFAKDENERSIAWDMLKSGQVLAAQWRELLADREV